jgi:hypothetical protein
MKPRFLARHPLVVCDWVAPISESHWDTQSTSRRSSRRVASFLIRLARKEMTAMFPRTYPRFGLRLSNDGELSVRPRFARNNGIPKTGHRFGMQMSSGTISKGIPALRARFFALCHIHTCGLLRPHLWLDAFILALYLSGWFSRQRRSASLCPFGCRALHLAAAALHFMRFAFRHL